MFGVEGGAPWLGAVMTIAGYLVLMLTVERTPGMSRAVKVAIKALPSIGFLWFAASLEVYRAAWGVWIAAGLVLSAVGDVLLVWPGPKAFVAGLGAFLLGHVAYAVGFVRHGIAWSAAAGALVVVGVAAGLFARWILPQVGERLRGPVIAYMLVISVMVAGSGGAVAHGAHVGLLVATVLFWLSDVSVAIDRFAGGGYFNRVWGLAFYYAAQLGLAYLASTPAP